jgi:hypothetical protein
MRPDVAKGTMDRASALLKGIAIAHSASQMLVHQQKPKGYFNFLFWEKPLPKHSML